MQTFHLRLFDPEYDTYYSMQKNGESAERIRLEFERETEELGLADIVIWVSADPAGPSFIAE